MSNEIEREAERVKGVYRSRAERGLDNRYEYWQRENLFIYQSRERALISLLQSLDRLPLAGSTILDVGCGTGMVLSDLTRIGARFDDLHGVDLIEDRVRQARELLPGATIEVGDAQTLPYPEASFHIVLGFTLLSSVTDDEARRRITGEMVRVAKPGGLIVLYDFRTNPTNPDVSPLGRKDVRALFSGRTIVFRGVTLAPPIVRALIRLPGGWLACAALEMLPFVRTHFLAAIRA
jgi:ubiquinone/menaquinone biosynthesis C-methylase UbiE